MNTPNQLSSELSKYFSKLGKKGGETNKKKGSDYFKWVRAHGVKRKVKAPQEPSPEITHTT